MINAYNIYHNNAMIIYPMSIDRGTTIGTR